MGILPEMYECVPYLWTLQRSQKRASDLLGLELQKVNGHMDAETQTWVLCKKSQCP